MSTNILGLVNQQYYEEGIRYSDEDRQYRLEIKKETSSSFYLIAKLLSSLIAVGFLLLFILSITSIITINWSIGLVGLLGSIGLSGAIWLTKKH